MLIVLRIAYARTKKWRARLIKIKATPRVNSLSLYDRVCFRWFAAGDENGGDSDQRNRMYTYIVYTIFSLKSFQVEFHCVCQSGSSCYVHALRRPLRDALFGPNSREIPTRHANGHAASETSENWYSKTYSRLVCAVTLARNDQLTL